MPTTVQKWGNSLGVRIPKAIASQANLSSGTEVEIETDGNVLTIRPKPQPRASRRRRRKYRLAEMLAKMKGPDPHGEMFHSGAVGLEVL